MFYDFTITIPARTTTADPIRQVIDLTHGRIHRIVVDFPPGCAKLVHLVILEHDHQVWPTNIDESFSADGYAIEFDEDYPLHKAPYALVLKGWAPYTRHSHDITVRIGILPIREATERRFIRGVKRVLRKE